MSGREAAQQLVEDIVKQHGYVRAATMDKVGMMSQEVRREIEDAFLKKDELIGANIITLARNLYSNNARFVFELLQNADDNHFTRASQRNELPYVSFDLHLHQNRIVVECNEDGFTRANLVAISNIGSSSKSNAQAYIGEKGIGFKSVFKVAYKVLIQSGDFTFAFNHKKGDSGMGMICPDWETDVPSLGSGVTRMTLFLHEDDQTSSQADDIRAQFQDLHGEMLLFLKNLKQITVRNFNDTDQLEETTTYGVSSTSENRKQTEVTTKKGSNISACQKYYHVTKHMATNLPRSDTRDYGQAEIILAFPLSKDSVPVQESQSVFAFLPLCEAGFKFIIHADFVTTANRQDIETSSPRNKTLTSSIADAFAKGVTQLCDNKTLQYQWMRYVPEASSVTRGPYWSQLVTSIRSRLQTAPVLRPASLGTLRLIGDLKNQARECVDKNKNPLFDDIVPELYTSPGYSSFDLQTLAALGLGSINMDEVIDRIRADLDSSYSRMKSTTDDDWHSCAARLISVAFLRKWWDRIEKIKRLNLVPLNGGYWTSSNSGPVYYPETHGLEIPDGVNMDLRLIRPTACSNEDRRTLFDHLGAKVASIKLVRDEILRQYRSVSARFITLERSVAHLRFLYLSHHYVEDFVLDDDLFVFTNVGDKKVKPGRQDVYLPTDDTLGASQLLAPKSVTPGDDTIAPGFEVPLLHDMYIRQAPDRPSDETLSWTEWLRQCLKLRTAIRLKELGQDRLSDACQYVSNHRPQMFLAMLQSVWPSQRSSIIGGQCDLQLRKLQVLCQDGTYHDLDMTYVPTESLQKLTARFLKDGDHFPWLHLEEPLSHPSRPPEWELITEDLRFGFVDTDYKTGWDFCLVVLKYLVDSADPVSDGSLPARVYDLYLFLEAKIRESTDKSAAMYHVNDFFEYGGGEYLYLVCKALEFSTWECPSECVWDSPLETMSTKYVLKRLYSQAFSTFDDDLPQLESFFKKTLQIPDCGWEHIIDELEDFRSSKSTDLDRLVVLYSCLDGMKLDLKEEQSMREAFAAKPLICSFVDSKPSWHIISECLWVSVTRIPGKTAINKNGDYDDLEKFFLGRLKVPKMTIDMIYGKLKAPRSSADVGERGVIEEIKGDLLEFSALLRTTEKKFDPDPMAENRIFPVRFADGDVSLCTAHVHFAIADRKHLAQDFASKAAILDFGMEDVHRLRSFSEWVGVADRYLSKSVKEVFTADKASTRPLTQPDRAVSLRAHALLRIAAHFGSPRTRDQLAQEALYKLVRQSETLETQNINTTLLLNQGGQSYSVEKSAGNALQIDDAEDHLRIYLPRDRKDQETCFHSKLSKYLFDWMMDYPTDLNEFLHEGIKVVQAILTAHPCASRGLLEFHGIRDVTLGEHDAYDDEEAPASTFVSSGDNIVLTPPPSSTEASAFVFGVTERFSLSTPNRAPLGPQPSNQFTRGADFSSSTPNAIFTPPTPNAAFSFSTPNAAFSPSPPPVFRGHGDVDDTQYRNLLDKVIAAGRKVEMPSRGTFDMSGMQAYLPQASGVPGAANTPFVLRHTNRQERDRMIGAAGEAFVFEMLTGAESSLPGFGRDNWQSTIRHYVNAHRDYADMERWNGRETADITYKDTTGSFTGLLAEKGYLSTWDPESIARARPEYFFEVKATTGSCETPFFASKYQYRRMLESSQVNNGSEKQLDRVYVVFRVYNLGLDSISMRVLVDPKGLRQQGELAFTVENWSIVTKEIAR